jgi:formate dehydrogenase
VYRPFALAVRPILMSNPVTPPATKTTGAPKRGGKRGKVRSKPKGRAVDPTALEEVRALLGAAPRRRDLLIEHLHKIQDRYQCLAPRISWRLPPR